MAQFHFSIFWKSKKIQHFSRFTNKGPSIVERGIRTIRSLSKKQVFEKVNADWLSELPSVIKNYKNTIHSSIKMTPIQTFKSSNEKEVYQNLQNKSAKQQSNFQLGQLVRTADIKRVFSKGDSTNFSCKLYTITEVIHDTLPSY